MRAFDLEMEERFPSARAMIDAWYDALGLQREGQGARKRTLVLMALMIVAIVTAAADHVPPPLLQQLKPGGRMVIPVGSRYATQKLVLIAREEDGTMRTREILPVTFVPLTGKR